MNFLFVHRAGLSQYAAMARYLAQAGHRVVSISQSAPPVPDGITHLRYRPPRTSARLEPDARPIVSAIRNARAVAEAATRLKDRGFVPDLMLGHTGWGEILNLKEVWPDRPLLGNFEIYCGRPEDLDFDPEFPWPSRRAVHHRSHNWAGLASLAVADLGQSATKFQRASFPSRYRDAIRVLHEGVDTALYHPDARARIRLDGRPFAAGDENVTYCARALEPHRGFHIFMRSLPAVLARRPNAHVLIVGHGSTCYSGPPAAHRSYAEQLMEEIGERVDRSRIHFLGFVGPEAYRAVLRISAVHVYLTYPFVLSWSLIEAMASGCAIIASRTAPVEEVMNDSETGLLVDFFDTDGLADRICFALDHPEKARKLRRAARAAAVRRFDFQTAIRPRQLRIYADMIGKDCD